ncbi:MAG: zinc ribbon domain-containing protein [Chloroflexota bacterium]|nr:zinc ribbon domain-containing protein [Chloroflexota bacterium]
MPLYEFRCQCCGERFERLVRASAASSGDGDERIVCPRCQGTQVERLFSAFATKAPACDPVAGGG